MRRALTILGLAVGLGVLITLASPLLYQHRSAHKGIPDPEVGDLGGASAGVRKPREQVREPTGPPNSGQHKAPRLPQLQSVDLRSLSLPVVSADYVTAEILDGMFLGMMVDSTTGPLLVLRLLRPERGWCVVPLSDVALKTTTNGEIMPVLASEFAETTIVTGFPWGKLTLYTVSGNKKHLPLLWWFARFATEGK